MLDKPVAARMPREAKRGVAAHAAKPVELACFKPRLRVPQQWLDQKIARWHPNERAIARSRIIEIVDHAEARGAGHVLRHDRGVPRNVPAQVARQHPHVEIVAGARTKAHEHADLPLGVELVGSLRRDRRREEADEGGRESDSGSEGHVSR